MTAPHAVLRETRGACSTCLAEVPASVVRDADTVRLVKHCPEHGDTEQRLSTDPDYWADLDRYYFDVNPGEYPQRDFIVRMTERCNLDCPICLAKANTEDTPDLDLSGLAELLGRRRGLKIDLMAAEPTLRADLEDWVRRVKDAGHIAALHTNGIKLGDLDYCRRLKEAGVDEVFLQFDGFDEDANRALRGAKLLERRMRALDNLREVGLATSLIVVIAGGLNEEQIGETWRFALRPENDHIRELLFLGLRLLGSARDRLEAGEGELAAATLMPDDLIGEFTRQVPGISRVDIRRFNKAYFAMLGAFRVRKCLYIQHYLVARTRQGPSPVHEWLDLEGLERAAERYRERVLGGGLAPRARLMAELARVASGPRSRPMWRELLRLQDLLRQGMNLSEVPRRMLLVGFITACDPANFDAAVALNCGKGELSSDGGFHASGAWANLLREQRFSTSDRRPGHLRRKKDR